MQYACASSGSAQLKSCSTFPVLPLRLLAGESVLHHIPSPRPVAAPPSQCTCLFQKCSQDQTYEPSSKLPSAVSLNDSPSQDSKWPEYPFSILSSHYSWLEELFIPLLYLHAVFKFLSFTNGATVLKSRGSVLTLSPHVLHKRKQTSPKACCIKTSSYIIRWP